MPKSFLSERDRQSAYIKREIMGQMQLKRIRQRDLAEAWGVSQAGAGYKIRNGSITMIEFWEMQKLLGFEGAEILRMLGGMEE